MPTKDFKIPDYSETHDEYLRHRESLLIDRFDITDAVNQLLSGISADQIQEGVFGGISRTTGIEMRHDRSADVTFLQSRNYDGSATGWRIDSDGNAFFYSVTASGYIQVGGAAVDVNTHTTTISGGKITAGSITATQIAAGTITANEIAASAITASKIHADALTGKTLKTADDGNFRVEIRQTGELAYPNQIVWVSQTNLDMAVINGNIDGSIYIYNQGATSYIGIGSGVFCQGNFTPSTANIYDLGSSTLTWKDLYLDGAIKKADWIDFTTRASDPLSPTAGLLYFNSTVGKLKVYNGTAWETVSSA